MSGEKAFEQFCAEYGDDAGEEVMERIADAMWDKNPGDRIKIADVHTLNACNHIVDGDIEHAGEWFSFSVESGNSRGTYVRAWGACAATAMQSFPRSRRNSSRNSSAQSPTCKTKG